MKKCIACEVLAGANKRGAVVSAVMKRRKHT